MADELAVPQALDVDDLESVPHADVLHVDRRRPVPHLHPQGLLGEQPAADPLLATDDGGVAVETFEPLDQADERVAE